MPYFYHLKLELYPYPFVEQQSKALEGGGKQGAAWVPPQGADIFKSSSWPEHKIASTQQIKTRGAGARRQELASETKRESLSSQEDRRGSVIDCGPSRATNSSDDDESVATILPLHTQPEFPPPNPANILPNLKAAQKDWRFGPVRIEELDMADRPGHKRGESSLGLPLAGSGNGNGLAAGLGAGLTPQTERGRVTKARFEEVQNKGTNVGWGIVHLYRDGEESLGSSETQVYPTSSSEAADTSGASSGLPVKEEEEDYTTLCIPAVPSYLTPSDFLGFVGEKTREDVSHFRMVMTGKMNRYLVLMKFRDSAVARKWQKEWDGKVFNSMEPETCHVAPIKSITFQTPSASTSHSNTSFPELSHDPFTPSSSPANLKPFPPPTPNLIELPTCPVCLERMDDTTGLLTILCQHVFHCSCLQKWRGSGCPVCRHTNSSPSLPPGSHSQSSNSNSSSNPYYDPSHPPFGTGDASICSSCSVTDDLWICLICGNVGCGRYKKGHAKEHWKDSAHNFALEIETQHVWDYAGDLWVHRLIRDKAGDKVIELPSRSRGLPGGRDEEDMVPREKLEGIGLEYTHLLTSQLESQRIYFEDLVSKAVNKASSASSSAAESSTMATEALSRVSLLEAENKKLRSEIIADLEKELVRERKKSEKFGKLARGLGKSLQDEKKVSEGLMERIKHVNEGMAGMSMELTKIKEQNEGLKEENRDLLFSITAGQKIQDMAEDGMVEAGDLEGGMVSLPPEKRVLGKGKGKKK